MKRRIIVSIVKSINEVSWNVSEEVYRKDSSFSYSKLSSFLRDGPEILRSEDRKDTEALRFGSLLDCLLTEPETFDSRFVVSNYQKAPEGVILAINYLVNLGITESSLENIDKNILITAMDVGNYCSSYKEETRINNLLKYQSYYNLKLVLKDKIVITQDDYNQAKSCLEVLQTHSHTKNLMSDYYSFIEGYEVVSQPKFKTVLNNIPVRCMFDRIIVDHNKKEIFPIDLKTTSKKEYKFGSSIIEWNYYIQATMYRDILIDILSKDEYFRKFTVLPFTFVVINRYRQKPMAHIYEDSKENRTLLEKHGYKHYSTLLEEASWHTSTGLFDYPKHVYDKGGIDTINLSNYLK